MSTFESIAAQMPDIPWEEWYETRGPVIRARADQYPPGFYIHIPSGQLVQILAYTEAWPPDHVGEPEYSYSDTCVICGSDWQPIFGIPYTELKRTEERP